MQIPEPKSQTLNRLKFIDQFQTLKPSQARMPLGLKRNRGQKMVVMCYTTCVLFTGCIDTDMSVSVMAIICYAIGLMNC